MSYENLITVNYSGGAGGEFFCHLLDSSINNTPFNAQGDANNKYKYEPYVQPVGDLNFYQSPFFLYHLQKDPNYRTLFELSYDSDSKTISDHPMYSNMYNLYLHVKDEDDDVVKQNIVDIYRQFVVPPDSYKITFFYNIKLYTPGITLTDIYPNSKNLVLTATNLEYLKVFWFLAWFKNKPNFTGLLRDIQTYQYITNIPSDPQFLNEHKIYMDKIMFDDDFESYIDQVNLELSNMLGEPVNLDIEAIRAYRTRNQQIIREFFTLSDNEDILSEAVVNRISDFMNNDAF